MTPLLLLRLLAKSGSCKRDLPFSPYQARESESNGILFLIRNTRIFRKLTSTLRCASNSMQGSGAQLHGIECWLTHTDGRPSRSAYATRHRRSLHAIAHHHGVALGRNLPRGAYYRILWYA